MSKIDKMHYRCIKELKIFGIKVAEFTDNTTRYDGDGEFISEAVLLNREYYEKEFKDIKQKDVK